MKIKELEIINEIKDKQEEKVINNKKQKKFASKIMLGMLIIGLIILTIVLSKNIIFPMGGYYLGGPTV